MYLNWIFFNNSQDHLVVILDDSNYEKISNKSSTNKSFVYRKINYKRDKRDINNIGMMKGLCEFILNIKDIEIFDKNTIKNIEIFDKNIEYINKFLNENKFLDIFKNLYDI
jgi:hypothetical protein